MSFSLTIPRSSGDPLQVHLECGDFLFVLGPNGAGKSGLMQTLFSQHTHPSRRISAHRQTWIESEEFSITPQQRKTFRTNFDDHDAQPAARWRENASPQGVRVATYDLIDCQNKRARAIADAIDAGDIQSARDRSSTPAPIVIINELLQSSNLSLSLSIDEDEQVFASKNGSDPFSIAKLSDGERSALLVAASVLTAQSGTLILIDEPERHLHRSIVSPLLTALFARCSDCAFVVSTHDISLCADHEEASIVLLRDCDVDGDRIVSWDADLVPVTNLDDDFKLDILGSRRTILYVEGDLTSLDMLLYSILFPDISVVPKDNCREVERAVEGVRSSHSLHWLRALGLIDSDGRSADHLTALKIKYIFAVDAYSVESIYYHELVQKAIAIRHAQALGGDASKKVAKGKAAALLSLEKHVSHLSLRIAEKSIRSQVAGVFPTKEQMANGDLVSLTIDCGEIVKAEEQRFRNALDSGDLPALMKRYPLRETPALNYIASNLGFKGRDEYEDAVRHALASDPALFESVRSFFRFG